MHRLMYYAVFTKILKNMCVRSLKLCTDKLLPTEAVP